MGGPNAGEGVQLDLVGSIFAQFALGAPSNDLINADYIVALPLTFRRRGFSARVRVYHQSSHLGDEYLLRGEDIERENISFESVEFLLSQELGPLRAYGGTERLFRREPETLASQLSHGGLEFRSGRAGPIQVVSGVDVKTAEAHGWSPAISPAGFVPRGILRGAFPVRAILSGRYLVTSASASIGNTTVLDYYLFPRIDVAAALLRLSDDNGLRLDAYRAESLDGGVSPAPHGSPCTCRAGR